jgi:hypothetical protein
MRAARDERDIGAGPGQRCAESSSNAPGANNRNTHGISSHLKVFGPNREA